MRSLQRTATALILAWAALPAGAAPPQVKPIIDLRYRFESLDTPARVANADRTYDMNLARARAGVDLKWPQCSLHGLLQGAAMNGVPRNGAFGSGPSYFASNGETGPSQLGVAELSGSCEAQGFKITAGRLPYADGFEAPTGVPYLDGVKRLRLSDRLIGAFEFTNVGRRYDGATLGYDRPNWRVDGFGLRPLTGGFNYDDAFAAIDRVSVYGATFTAKHGKIVPGSDLRGFVIHYGDDRAVARALAGGELKIDTIGSSLLLGDENNDLLLWVALQRGDWGALDQKASAFLVDLGHRFPRLPGKPAVSLAWEQASGDRARRGEHGTFFNLLPTNHKFYGSLDYVALSNLRDLYVEARTWYGEAWRLRFALHDFALLERGDAWYGGSGAFEAGSFGYTPRRPRIGGFPSKRLGREADLDVTWNPRPKLTVGFGGGVFQGGSAAEAFLPVEKDGRWLYLELGYKL